MPEQVVDEPEVTDGQALATIIRVCGPIMIIYRGDPAPWEVRLKRQQKEAARRWLRETALHWVKAPTWREFERGEKGTVIR